MSGSSRSPARNRYCRHERSYAPDSAPSGSSFLDRPDRRRRGEQRLHPVLGDHPPERARIRCADRFAFVEHGRRAGQQRRVDDVGVADDPADIGGGPEHLARARCRRCGACVHSSATACPPLSRRCLWVSRLCPRCRARTAGRSPRPAPRRRARRRPSVRASPDRGPAVELARLPVALDDDAVCGRGAAPASSAASSIGLYSTVRDGSMPHEADTTTVGRASSIRAASSCAAKPPNTTECTAPMPGAR